jgi:hypothetical protein
MSSVPPLFTCCVCGLSLRPADVGVERLVLAWLKSKGTSVSRVVEEQHKYKHAVCSDKEISEQIPLF